MNSEQRITKAVIAAAGIGSRMLPATKAIPKEMLTIVDRPVIQLIVEELVAAGITDILFVTSPGKNAIKEHFDPALELEESLAQSGKHSLRDALHELSALANFSYMLQSGPYGNGTPVLCAESFVAGEPFIYVWPDDLVLSKTPFTKQLISRYQKTGCPVIGVDEVPYEEVHRYGVVDLDPHTGSIRRVVEKPAREDAPSNLVQFGRMVLTRDIIDILKETALGKGNELWLTDAIAAHVARGNVFLAERIPDGKWLTTGDPLNNLKALVEHALVAPEVSESFRAYLRDRLQRD
ncbi:MAG TPA: UTP--glucose-1-phosphate uridylyltransferase [Candidatus Paceibacterota bacterium]|nr:UTP--glucose-1-phosphate uridylyltransferase [Candidatus Paceibacterota bacterium]